MSKVQEPSVSLYQEKPQNYKGNCGPIQYGFCFSCSPSCDLSLRQTNPCGVSRAWRDGGFFLPVDQALAVFSPHMHADPCLSWVLQTLPGAAKSHVIAEEKQFSPRVPSSLLGFVSISQTLGENFNWQSRKQDAGKALVGKKFLPVAMTRKAERERERASA